MPVPRGGEESSEVAGGLEVSVAAEGDVEGSVEEPAGAEESSEMVEGPEVSAGAEGDVDG